MFLKIIDSSDRINTLKKGSQIVKLSYNRIDNIFYQSQRRKECYKTVTNWTPRHRGNFSSVQKTHRRLLYESLTCRRDKTTFDIVRKFVLNIVVRCISKLKNKSLETYYMPCFNYHALYIAKQQCFTLLTESLANLSAPCAMHSSSIALRASSFSHLDA